MSSGSVDFTTTRNALIRMAALDLNAIPSGSTPGPQIVADFSFSLNAMIKAWGATGLHVWEVKDATLFPQPSQVKYAVGPSSTDHVTESYVQTALSASVSAAATTISVDSTSRAAVADKIGIVLDDGTIHWSTISSKTSTTLSFPSGLADSASSGAAVFTYTSNISRPLRIVGARRHNIDAANDTPLILVSREEYNALSVKTATATINQFFYDKQIPNGQIYLWQPQAVTDDLVKFTWHKMIDDFDAAGDNPDLPQEWIMALRYNLAESMIAQFPVSDSNVKRIMMLAAKYLDMVMGHDREDESIFAIPDLTG